MADRTSAGCFGDMFNLIALGFTGKNLAKKLWNNTIGYDFTDDQMGCDDALLSLGLAKECKACGGIIYLRDDADVEHEEWCGE